MTTQSRTFRSVSPEDTQKIATVFATMLVSGDTVFLEGPIGAGKSQFTRAAIQALLVTPEDVPSPTYTLVQTYLGRSCEIWHADLYRLSDANETHELGLWAAFEDAICFVEWPDRLGAQAPPDALTLAIATDEADDTRNLHFSWSDPRWNARWMEVFGDQPAGA